MSVTAKMTRKATLQGVSYNSTIEKAADNVATFDADLAAAKTGALTTRTDNDTGTLTMAAGHGIATGARLDVYWDGGCRYGMTVGTVATNSVPVDGGAGDNLPAAATEITAMVPDSEALVVTGNNAVGLLTSTTSQAQAVAVLATSGDVLIKACVMNEDGGNSYTYLSGDGQSNPVSGGAISKVFLSHGDSTATRKVRGALMHN